MPGAAPSAELEALSRAELEQRAAEAGIEKPELYSTDHLIYGIQKRGAIGPVPPWGLV